MSYRGVVPGDIYVHFKGMEYIIENVACHTESGEQLVIYRALYSPYTVYARPIEMFLSPVDKEKYPESKKEYRFTRIG